MNGSLPPGWVETTIGAVTTFPAQRQPNVDETFVYIDISSIDRDTKRIENPQQLLGKDAPSRARKVVAAGDVLVSMTRPNLNAVALVPAELDGQIASTGFDVLRPNGVDPRWLFYIVRSADFVTAMTDLVQGALYPAVKSSDVRSYRIQLPPLAEQQRIAATLDRLLARVDGCRARLARVPALLKRFRQAVLAAAVTGRLTEDWRGENGFTLPWNTVALPDVAQSRLGKMLDKAKNQGTLTPYLRNINVRWFDFDLTDIQEIRISPAEAESLFVRSGDVLVCEGGEPGRCAVWRGENNTYVFQKALHRVQVGDELLPDWLCYCLKAEADSGRLEDLFTGTTIKHLTGVALARFEFGLPALPEQHEIVRRVETLFAYADRLEARLAAAQARVAQLTPSLLGKAFRGELGTTTTDGESNG